MNTIARTSISIFIEDRLNELNGHLSYRDVALMSGFQSGDIIQMFMSGEAKVPLDRVPSLAQALGCDAAHLFVLALEQVFEPAIFVEIREYFTRSQSVTTNEWAWLQVIRAASGFSDPGVTLHKAQRVRKVFFRGTAAQDSTYV
jgi:hypothetical protein